MIDFGIIAGGESSRIMKEGSALPKPMLKIGGTPMIERLVKVMEEAGADSINILVNQDMPEVSELLEGLVPSLKCQLRIKSAKTPSSMHSLYELLQLMKPEAVSVV